MTAPKFDQLLAAAIDSVLETMFFTAASGPAEPQKDGAVLRCRIGFRGSPSGAVGLCISERSAKLLSTGFLGEEEETLTASQTGHVVCELANMICGSLVSKLESEENFYLSSPELVPAGSGIVDDCELPAAACQSFELEGGTLTVTLSLGAST